MSSLSHVIQQFDYTREFTAPPEWLQGRTVYGGLSAALALQSILQMPNQTLPPLKSALISFVGPVKGPMRFKPQVLRRGKSSTFISVDCLVGSDTVLRAGFLFAEPRTSQIRQSLYEFPKVSDPTSYQSMIPIASAPALSVNFELKPVTSTLPLSGATHPELLAWLRHGDAANVAPTVSLIALADALPPAVLSTITDMVPISSMTWSIDFSSDSNNASEWHLLRSTSQHSVHGYSYQTMEIWDENKNLVASGSQTVAVFG
ncbi:thioesterase family protein [Marinomonas sp. TW1]|uniref:thioesterase family protein n=1 Tax=Marinomonas sp. TW1 TaxID=1561203 RepID=UPI0007AEEE57|nr:thioesterase family protein [Marinomonas sp. TW1]KZN14765.1 hypothetical protein OA79_03430 [Marinomonas sp. TW1]